MTLPIFLGPRNGVRSLATGLLASFCAAQAGCGLIGDDGIACTAVSVESLVGTVRDEAGNPLPVFDVQARMGRRTFASCHGKLGGFSCRDLPACEATVTARTQGQELTGSVQLSWAAGEEGCHTASAELALVKPGASCPALESLSERSALRGSVRDSLGAPVSLGSVLIVPSERPWERDRARVAGPVVDCAGAAHESERGSNSRMPSFLHWGASTKLPQ